MKQEIWKSIKGYEGLYEVSNWGQVKSLSIIGHRNKDIIMTPTLQVSGYHIIGLTKNGEQKIFRFHRIVAAHFCKKKKGCNIVNHKNGVKTDNRSENLEWTTVSGNTSHSFAMGLQKPRMGERSNWAVLSEAEVVEIREKHKTGTYTQKQLGIMFNVSRTAITMIVNRKRWSHI